MSGRRKLIAMSELNSFHFESRKVPDHKIQGTVLLL